MTLRRVVLTMTMVLLAGCGGLASDETMPIESVRVQGGCVPSGKEAGWCIDGDDGVTIQGIEIDASATDNAALAILGGPNITVRDVSVSSAAGGIVIQPVRCPCTVRLSNITLVGDPDGGSVGAWVAPPAQPDGPVDVTAETLHVRGHAIGVRVERIHTSALEDVSIECRTTGLDLGSATSVRIDGAAIDGCADVGIDVGSVERLHGTDIAVTGSGTGIHADSGTAGMIGGLSLLQNGLGMLWTGGTLQGDGWQVQDNGGAGDTDDGAAAGGMSLSTTLATVHNSVFTGNRPVAVHAATGVDFSVNWWGSAEGPRVAPFYGAPAVGPGGDAVTPHVQTRPHLDEPPHNP